MDVWFNPSFFVPFQMQGSFVKYFKSANLQKRDANYFFERRIEDSRESIVSIQTSKVYFQVQ